MLKPKTLQQRLSLFMLLPVAVLLITMGLVVFTYASDNLLAQWKEAAILKLARAAHDVDMRLSMPKGWMKLYYMTGGESGNDSVRRWVAKHLENMEGVERVTLTRTAVEPEESQQRQSCTMTEGTTSPQCYTWSKDSGVPWKDSWMEKMQFDRAEISGVTVPRYDDVEAHETVSLTSDLLGKDGVMVGKLDVVIRFQYLIEGALSFGWSRNEKAFLVSSDGKVLACNLSDKAEQACHDEALGAAIKAMEREPFGTLIRPDDSRQEVIGFYRLKEAPWSLVVVAESGEILAPIFRFRLIFFGMMAAFFLVILLLIRLVAGKTVASIRTVSSAAERVARGEFDALPPVQSRDEVGQLIQSFNEMVSQLGERIRLKEALDLAMQVQQSLLPTGPPRVEGLEIDGTSLYCDETGGDYYDFIHLPNRGAHRLGIAVGDVAGHGISAALFMTTARALLRSRMTQPGSLSEVMGDVNRLLCADTGRTGDFMSLFLILVDVKTKRMRWIRAGHAPAIIYDWESDAFEELRGEGVSLGLDEESTFQEYEYTEWSDTKLLFLGTDGIWEAENPEGEMFGMDRLRGLIREHCQASPNEIIHAATDALEAFRRESPQEDDVTLVVVKAAPRRDHTPG